MFDLEKLDALEKAATPGPWRLKPGSANTIDSEFIAQELWSDKRRISFTDWHRVCSLDMHFGGTEDDQHKADIAFIAALRNSAPAILAELREPRRLLEIAMRKMAYLIRDYPGDKESKAWYEAARVAQAVANSEKKDG